MFINNLQIFQEQNKFYLEYGKINFMKQNNPVAVYMTNKNNIAMFNNGTLHYNITLPTELNEKKKIKNMEYFKFIHKKAIKIIQWFEPILIAIYNTPDPFSYILDNGF
jgi:hypothetical protein